MTVQLICSFQLHISTHTTTNLRSHPIRSFSLSNRDHKGSSTEGKETEHWGIESIRQDWTSRSTTNAWQAPLPTSSDPPRLPTVQNL